ncbi:MAG: hypothetical protein ACYDAK_12940 [Candidatus Limnocylindrales bacterium]
MLGVTDRMGELSPGLRRVAKGFKASDGYNLRDLREGRWTPAMKRKVSMYFHELQQLTAQEKMIVVTKSPTRLRNAQAIGGHDPKFKFKVAFVPGTSKSRVEWADDDTPIIRERGYDKRPVEFDREALAVDPDAEIARVLASPKLKGVKRFGIMTGPNVMLGGGIPDRGNLPGKIKALMAKYDGKKPLPRSSGNRGDRPGAHKWEQWLFGVQGFRFTKDPDKIAPAAFAQIEIENAKLRRRRANMRKKTERQSHARKRRA